MNPLDPSLSVLVVDDADSFFLMRHLLQKGGVTGDISHADGEDAAMEYLRQFETSSEALPLAALVNVDTPSSRGHEIIQWIRSYPGLKEVLVFALSSSTAARDIARAYESGADSYIVKYPKPSMLAELFSKAMKARLLPA
jgi:CheY-like chemotaxis protein